ncbi:MAG: NAD(P)H-hydrate dehydratase [Chitinophagaceae bacterium]|nr:NAD(P)H-hydrate dehydratase [Chitinophagaceae bacterium]
MNTSLPGFLDPENPANVAAFLKKQGAGHVLTDEKLIRALVKPRDAAAHKNAFGHLLLAAGAEGTYGAAILSAKAALRTGCGLITASIPSDARTALLTVVPEAMTLQRIDSVTPLLPELERFNAIAFGPGIGREAGPLLLQLLRQNSTPMVIDADGLNLLSENKDWLPLLSERIVLTPHPGEFDRLTGHHTTRLERLQTQLSFSEKYRVTVLLKGRYTSVSTAAGGLFFNTTGNDGMATAGSGDVLTGIIGSLLAQGYEPGDAAVLGAYLHGYAGDRSANIRSRTALIASDIIDGVGEFFRAFEK